MGQPVTASTDAMQPDALCSVDALVRAAEREWRLWRADHPLSYRRVGNTAVWYVVLPHHERVAIEAAEYEERRRIGELLIPREKAALLTLAADDRVWRQEVTFHGPLAECITSALQCFISEAIEAVDAGKESRATQQPGLSPRVAVLVFELIRPALSDSGALQ